MRETPRSQETAGGSEAEPPQHCLGRATAHTTGASGSGTPHRSDGRSPQTPRGARRPDPAGCFGTTPPVPRQPAFPRAVLLALLVLCAAGFSLITWQVAAGGPLRSLDERVGAEAFGRGPKPLTELLADLGGTAVALPVLAAAVAYTLWRERQKQRHQQYEGHRRQGRGAGAGRRYDVLGAVLAMAAVPALVVPLKALVDRPGPLTEATGYYPSGHTATAMAAYCGAAVLVRPYLPRMLRAWAMPAALFLTLATGIGLVFRGYHWPLDVVASWCLCGTVLLISSIGRRRSSARTPTGCSGPS
ncbi:phosphatase PAP2 family protein [Streptomyces sp. NPDC004609]|uniref:phosphatase PAP2 family protein n=1 Tax=Streptomyces sp. NPDC004609 TaxID=3364704 RepID=UPI0036986ABE